MTDPAVLLERRDGVAVITLNRPVAGNTVNVALASDLEAIVSAVAGDADVRCVVLTGAGKLFCGGGDIVGMAEAGDDAGLYLQQLASALHRSVALLSAMDKPLVVLVNGSAAGAGLSLALLGDIVLSVPGATFMAAYGGVGLTPDGGMSWLLPRLVGLRRAQDIIIGGSRVAAAEAERIGLVTRLVDADALAEEGFALARRLADGPVAAIGGARRLLGQSFTNDLATHLALEADRIGIAGAGAECREGVAAFLDRRKPDFRRTAP